MEAFARLRRRLEEKAKDLSAKPVTYVAIGDSVTQGLMETGVLEHERVYPQLLRLEIAKRHPYAVVNVINAGVGGETAHQSRSRWQRDVISHQPDLVTIKYGLNDVHEGAQGLRRYIEAIRDLVLLIQTETDADLLLLTPSMLMKRDNSRIAGSDRRYIPTYVKLYEENMLAKYVEALRSFAAASALPLLDVYAMWEKMEEEGEDIHERLANGIDHPDRKFHQQLAEAMAEHILGE